MNRSIAVPLVLGLLLSVLPGCKFVETGSGDGSTSSAAGEDSHIADLVASTFDSRLVPLLQSKASDISVLRTAIATDLEQGGKSLGIRGGGDGGMWSFAVSGTGRIVSADLKSRAGRLELDTDDDGAADISLQLGPVIKGTALRDVAPFYVFTDFRDQIEFAKLARGLNERAVSSLRLPEGDLAGKLAKFTGAFAIHTAKDPVLVVPVALEVTE